MNKKMFLKELEAKLFILDESERKDIISEYSGVIDEKKAHGKTEEEAINDFGSVETLTKEILSAYKINPEFNDQKKKKYEDDDYNDFKQGADHFIKKAADEFSKFIRNLVNGFKNNDQDITIESIFEIVIKVVIILALLMIPFALLRVIGHGISDTLMFQPLNRIMYFVWELVVGGLYLVACILVISSTMKNVLDRGSKATTKKETTHDETIVGKKSIKANQISEDKKETKDNPNSFMNIVISIVKVIVVLWTLPLIFLTGMSYFGLVILVYLMTKGLFLYGLIVLLTGISLFLSYLIHVIFGILFNNKKIRLYPVIIAIAVMILGVIMSVDYFINLNYYETLPTGKYELTTTIIEKNITKDVRFIEYVSSDEIIIDNTLPDNKMIIEVSYYKDFTKYSLHQQDISCGGNVLAGDLNIIPDNCTGYYFYTSRMGAYQNILNDFIDNLKQGNIYRFNSLYDLDVKVKINQVTSVKIK